MYFGETGNRNCRRMANPGKLNLIGQYDVTVTEGSCVFEGKPI